VGPVEGGDVVGVAEYGDGGAGGVGGGGDEVEGGPCGEDGVPGVSGWFGAGVEVPAGRAFDGVFRVVVEVAGAGAEVGVPVG
jgi:hypothetical protein